VTDQYGDTAHYWTPAADRLSNPINQDQPTDINTTGNAFDNRFKKWGSVPAGAPLAAPDLPDSFEGCFENWDSVTPRSSVLRALETYKRSVAPDAPASTSVQRPTPGMPALAAIASDPEVLDFARRSSDTAISRGRTSSTSNRTSVGSLARRASWHRY
jgi:hypothetical protein